MRSGSLAAGNVLGYVLVRSWTCTRSVGRDDPSRSVQTSHNSDLQLSLATSTTRRNVTRSSSRLLHNACLCEKSFAVACSSEAAKL